MNDFLHFLGLVAVVIFPFLAMAIMWRRMKSVRDRVYHDVEPMPPEAPWQEPIHSEHGLTLARSQHPNDELIALGAKEKQATWTLTNQ